MALVMPFPVSSVLLRGKAHKVIGDADALSALSAALVGGIDVDTLDKLSQGVGCHFLQVLVFVYPLNELL